MVVMREAGGAKSYFLGTVPDASVGIKRLGCHGSRVLKEKGLSGLQKSEVSSSQA